MASPDALYVALDLFDRPSLVAIMRERALPPNVITLVKIAANSPDAIADAVARTGRSPTELRTASIFYIRQVMWTAGADSYRILGVAPEAPHPRIAEQVRWLMKWLHPDVAGQEVGPETTARVLRAWETLKTADRRKNYHRLLRQTQPKRTGSTRQGRALGIVQRPVPWVMRGDRKSGLRTGFGLVERAATLAGLVVAAIRARSTRLLTPGSGAKSPDLDPIKSSGQPKVRGSVEAELVENR